MKKRYGKKKKGLIEVRTDRINNYLQQNGLVPVYEWGDSSFYKHCNQFHLLMDRYHLEKYVIPNKL